MSESNDNKNAGLKKKYGVMVLTDYGDAAKLTRQPSGGTPTPVYLPPTPVFLDPIAEPFAPEVGD